MSIFRRIRDLREDHDLNQQDMAAILNIAQSTYSRYESGIYDLPTDILIKLADFYGTSIDYLLERTDTPLPYPSSFKKENPNGR